LGPDPGTSRVSAMRLLVRNPPLPVVGVAAPSEAAPRDEDFGDALGTEDEPCLDALRSDSACWVLARPPERRP
jgi:hypothetical protein